MGFKLHTVEKPSLEETAMNSPEGQNKTDTETPSKVRSCRIYITRIGFREWGFLGIPSASCPVKGNWRNNRRMYPQSPILDLSFCSTTDMTTDPFCREHHHRRRFFAPHVTHPKMGRGCGAGVLFFANRLSIRSPSNT